MANIYQCTKFDESIFIYDRDMGSVQFLSDELSEVSRNPQFQFLRADFAAVSEVSGKNRC